MLAQMYIQVIINGLVNGLIFALIATGFTLIYGNANILFFAVGEIYMLGSILMYVLTYLLGIPFIVALSIVAAALGFFGVVIERFIFRYLEGNELTFALASVALGMLIVGVALEVFGEKGRAVHTPFPGKMNVFGVILTYEKLAIVLFALCIIIALHLFFSYTKAGRAIRAVSQDAEVAQLVGIRIKYTKALTFFLGLAVTATSGGLIAPLYYVDVFMGGPILMRTLMVVVLGGLGSFPGAIVGGLFIGLLESFGYTFLGGITTIFSFAFVIALLAFRPQGLFGHV